METCKLMSREISRIAAKHGLDLTKSEAHLRLTLPGFMPLVIEKVGRNLVTVTHYFYQNGDTLADPDVMFCMYPGGWVPVEMTQCAPGGYTKVAWLGSDGTIAKFAPKAMRSVAALCRTWATNIRDQGWCARGVKEDVA